MATATLRPNATNHNSGWTLSTGSTAHTLVDDDPADDATYVQAAAGAWLLVFDLGGLTLPAYAQIRSVAVRVRRRGNSTATFDVACGYQPVSGGYQSALLSSGEKPTSTIATKTYGSLVAAPGGLAWDNSTVIPNFQVSLGANNTNVRVYEVYADVVYDEAPLAVVTSPVGEIVGTQVPTVEFGYSDTEGSALERVHAKIFTAAQHAAAGFGPDTASAAWDSGTVLTSAQRLAVGTPLPEGDYRVYVRVADAGSGGRFGPWASAEFTMGGQLPATPTLSGVSDDTYRRNVLTVTQRDNLLSYGQSTSGTSGGDGWYADHNTVLDSISSTAPTATTLVETFTGGSGALSGANTDINWTVVRGAFAVSSNQLTSSDSGLILPSVIRTDSSLPAVDHYAQVVVNALSTTVDRSCHLVLRMASSGYAGISVELNQKNGRFAVWEAVTATTGRAVSGFRSLPKPLALPATWRAVASGNQVYVYIQMANDSELKFLGQWTTSVLTGTQIGLGLYNAGSTSLVDSFEAGDLEPLVSGASGASGAGLLEVTATAARQARVISGGRYGWGTPVTAGEQLTVTGSAWQAADAARSCRVDVEYFGSGGDPLADVTLSEPWTGTDGAAWSTSTWTADHGTGATDTIQSDAGRLTTGSIAYLSPARMYASGTAAVADSEVLVKLTSSSLTAETRGTVGLRTDGTWSLGYPGVGYFVELDPQNDVVLVRRGSGSTVLNGSGTAYTVPAVGTWVRLRCHGTTVAAKWWDGNRQEPAAWGFVTEDATHAAAGKVSVTAQNGADAAVRYWTFDDLAVDSMAYHSFGTAFTTATTGTLTESTRDVTAPAGAAYAKVVLVSFPTGGGEVFVWDKIGLMPGAGRDWSRGGLGVANLYDSDESALESTGTHGWAASTDAAVVRATDYPASPAGTALELAWSAGSGLGGAVYAYGPAKPATAGLDYAVRAWLWRVAADVSLLQLGLRFLDSSSGELTQSFAATVLPEVDVQHAEAAHTMLAPAGTATVQAVLACSPVQTAAAAVTRVTLVQGSDAPTVYQPGPAAPGYALCEYSDDGGQVWEQVRATASAAYPTSYPRTVTVYDNEAPPGLSRTYRASTAAVDYYLDAGGAATVVSTPSAEVPVTLGASGFWLRDPLAPARLLPVTVGGDLEHTSREPQEIHYPLGRHKAVAVSDAPKGEEFAWPFVFKTEAAWRQFEDLRASGSPLLFQSDFAEQWYVKLGQDRRVVLKNSIVRATDPLRLVEIAGTEVDRPDSSESNANTVTGIVWGTV